MFNYRPKHVLFQIRETECFSLWLVRVKGRAMNARLDIVCTWQLELLQRISEKFNSMHWYKVEIT